MVNFNCRFRYKIKKRFQFCHGATKIPNSSLARCFGDCVYLDADVCFVLSATSTSWEGGQATCGRNVKWRSLRPFLICRGKLPIRSPPFGWVTSGSSWQPNIFYYNISKSSTRRKNAWNIFSLMLSSRYLIWILRVIHVAHKEKSPLDTGIFHAFWV